jgi:hypothetical protein
MESLDERRSDDGPRAVVTLRDGQRPAEAHADLLRVRRIDPEFRAIFRVELRVLLPGYDVGNRFPIIGRRFLLGE